jgi:hypothetical protein
MLRKRSLLAVLPVLCALSLASTGCDKLMAMTKEKAKKAASSDDDDDDKSKKDKKKGKDDDEEEAKGPKQKAPTPEWKGEDEVVLGKAKGRFSVSEKLSLRLALSPVPKGTKVTSGAFEDTARSDGTQVLVDVDVSEALGKVKPDEAFNYKTKWKSGVKFVVALVGHEAVEIEAPAVAPNYGLKRALEGVKDRPVTFVNEPADAPKEHSVVYIGTLTPKVFGPAKTVSEIDWVALHEDLPARRGKMCPGYKDDKGGSPRTLPVEMQDREVVIFERKTAKEVARKKFEAPEKCPMFAFGDTAKSYPNERQIESWLRSQRGGGGGGGAVNLNARLR